MKRRWIVLGVTGGLVLALTAGLAYAAGTAHRGPSFRSASVVLDHSAMHQSSMQRMNAHMPADLAKQCTAMHEQMSQMMDEMSSMMSGSSHRGMMGNTTSSGMMGSSSGTGMVDGHAGHHSSGG